MLPPANQAPSASHSNASSSTAATTSSIASRTERDPKRYDRRSDLLCRVRYTNVLPDLPFDPKFLRYPFSKDRFVRYKPTSLEKNYRWDLLTEHDVGVEIDLINPDAYMSTGKLMKDEERLLEDESISPANKKRSMLNQRSVPWLRKTEYISTEQSTKRASRLSETGSSSAKDKILDESVKELTRDQIIQTIEEGFETAKSQLQKHYSKPSVFKVEEWPVFPDFDNWKYPFAQVIFDDDPYPAVMGDDDYLNKDPNSHTQEHLEEMSDAVIKAFVDDENKEYIGYFLPTAENRAKRHREAPDNEEEEEDDTYDFKLIREYTWNRKDKTMRGFEQNYFLVMKEDSVVYNELETRVRLNKRRVDPGVRMTKMKLIQSYRTFNEAEEQNQRKRLKALENEEETEEGNDEEEEQREEGDGDDEEQQQDDTQDGEENTREGEDDNDDDEQQQQDDGDDEEPDDD